MESGTKLGHYEISTLLGKGGMGEVWRARDTKLGRDVAIKTLPEEFAKDADRLARFEREARLLASLNHPNIAAIHGFEEDNGTHFLVLELVEGDTLADQIKRGAIPVEESLKLALQIAEALEAAHGKGVIHRDLKPANIKVTPDSKVKVLDFGLAKAFAGDQADVSVSNSPTLSMAASQQGIILGTAAYMSPEQARGETTDNRADIWAFGCVLFEMLTGTSVFSKGTLTETLARVLEVQPGFQELPAEIPPSIERLLRRCLDKNSRDRLQHIGDARVEIRDALAVPVIADRDARSAAAPKPQAKWVWAAGAIALIVLAAIAGSLVTRRSLPGPPAVVTRLSIGPVPGPESGPSGALDVAVSADGTHIAYQSGEQIWLKPMDQAYAVPIVTGINPFFSPDGERLAFFGGGSLNTISINGGAPVEITSISATGAGGRFAGGTWSADGTIAFATSLGLSLVSEDGGDPKPLAEPPDGQVYAWPQFMPDGESLLFTVLAGPSPDTAEIALLDLQTMTTRIVHQGGVGARYASEGYLVYLTGQGIAAIAFDPDAGRVRGASTQVPSIELQPDGAYLAADFAISDSGTLAHIPSGPSVQNWLVWVDHTGTEEILSGLPSGRKSYPRVSPEGDRVAFNLSTDGGTNRRIWVLDLERGVATQVSGGLSVEGAFEDLLPQWSEDGESLYFGSNRTGPFQVYSVAADGSGAEELVVDHPDVNMPYRVNPGNRMFFFSGSVSSNADTGLVNLADPSEPEWLLNSPYNELNAALSPDGIWIAYQSNESGAQREIFLRPFPNTDARRERVSDGGGIHALWDPRDGGELYYRNAAGEMMAVNIDTSPELAVSSPRRLFPNNNYGDGGGWPYDVSPIDGRFLMTQASEDPASGEVTIWVTLNWFEELKTLLPSP